jgi:hypothetical protein
MKERSKKKKVVNVVIRVGGGVGEGEGGRGEEEGGEENK